MAISDCVNVHTVSAGGMGHQVDLGEICLEVGEQQGQQHSLVPPAGCASTTITGDGPR